jgi:hypothetical protein
LTSSGITASSPYNNLKGVKFVAFQVDVLWDLMTLGSSSTHSP